MSLICSRRSWAILATLMSRALSMITGMILGRSEEVCLDSRTFRFVSTAPSKSRHALCAFMLAFAAVSSFGTMVFTPKSVRLAMACFPALTPISATILFPSLHASNSFGTIGIKYGSNSFCSEAAMFPMQARAPCRFFAASLEESETASMMVCSTPVFLRVATPSTTAMAPTHAEQPMRPSSVSKVKHPITSTSSTVGVFGASMVWTNGTSSRKTTPHASCTLGAAAPLDMRRASRMHTVAACPGPSFTPMAPIRYASTRPLSSSCLSEVRPPLCCAVKNSSTTGCRVVATSGGSDWMTVLACLIKCSHGSSAPPIFPVRHLFSMYSNPPTIRSFFGWSSAHRSSTSA
mmetsp:Transcript_17766/g.45734  ORF Transcript_17766/g.45734 Transcript_17766/m.45734 type:complete len:348 (+) Transcript_17766:2317-3360(+)